MTFIDRLRHRKSTRKRRGAAALELALMIPLFLLFIIGILEFGRAMMIHHVVTNSAREAVRMGIVSGATDAELLNSVDEYLDAAHLSETGRTVEIRDSNGNQVSITSIDSHEPVTVFISVPFHENSFGITSWFINRNISTQVTMRRE